MKTKTAPKIITVALLRDLETQVHIKQEISYSRMVEILNEKASQQVTAATEEMRKRIQELEAQVPKWISVEDRLPDKMDPVLILTSYGKIATAYFGYGSEPDHGWVDWMRQEHTYGSVTHWMPLPQPIK